MHNNVFYHSLNLGQGNRKENVILRVKLHSMLRRELHHPCSWRRHCASRVQISSQERCTLAFKMTADPNYGIYGLALTPAWSYANQI